MTHFTVRGEPRPQGSTRAFVKGGKPVITSTTKGLKDWRDAIAWEARTAMDGPLITGPVQVDATFTLARPKAHWAGDGWLKDSAPAHPAKRPDIDKLGRALLDALTDVAYTDDSLVVSLGIEKVYADAQDVPPGVEVWVTAR